MEFTHLDEQGKAKMVDVTQKGITVRTAIAKGRIRVSEEIMNGILDQKIPKGDVFATARVAGILGAKNTASTIPLCHPLPLTGCVIDFNILKAERIIEVRCEATVEGKTGVEMEALSGVSVALLTIYDMCKAMDKGMIIEEIHLVKKTGGKSGTYERGK